MISAPQLSCFTHTTPAATLNPEYQELKFTLHHKLLDRINLEVLAGIDDDRIRAEVRDAVLAIVEDEPNLLTAAEKLQISDEVLHEVFGLGPLEPLLHDPTISDILVNGHRQVYVERKGLLELTNVSFHDDAHLLRIIDKIVSQVGRRVDESNPMVDARLQRRLARECDHPAAGGRWAAALDPALWDRQADAGRSGGARRADARHDAAARGRGDGAAEHHHLGRHRRGQDDAAECALSLHRAKERIVTIEDAAELQLKQPHVARLETRPSNLEGTGAVKQRQLLVNSLRMRPDRIIVGEVRGEEALDMLQAMNTGHDGSLTTIHANSAARRDLTPGGDDYARQRQHAPDRHPAADRRGGAPAGAMLPHE